MRNLIHGVAVASMADLLKFESRSGRFCRTFTYYRSLGGDNNLRWERDFAQMLINRGTIPILTLQIQKPGAGIVQPDYDNRSIIYGRHDDILGHWADTLRQVVGTVVMRPMHEGNGDWYPWCAMANGNSAQSYMDAFRYLVRFFDRHDVDNVKWMWSMNKTFTGNCLPLRAVYPGADCVDEAGLSGYNGGVTLKRGGWRSFSRIFSDDVATLQGLHHPIFISETGCVEAGGSKAAWIADMWNYIAWHPEIAGLTWFNRQTAEGADWRIETSPQAQAAYRTGAIRVVPPRT